MPLSFCHVLKYSDDSSSSAHQSPILSAAATLGIDVVEVESPVDLLLLPGIPRRSDDVGKALARGPAVIVTETRRRQFGKWKAALARRGYFTKMYEINNVPFLLSCIDEATVIAIRLEGLYETILYNAYVVARITLRLNLEILPAILSGNFYDSVTDAIKTKLEKKCYDGRVGYVTGVIETKRLIDAFVEDADSSIRVSVDVVVETIKPRVGDSYRARCVANYDAGCLASLVEFEKMGVECLVFIKRGKFDKRRLARVIDDVGTEPIILAVGNVTFLTIVELDYYQPRGVFVCVGDVTPRRNF